MQGQCSVTTYSIDPPHVAQLFYHIQLQPKTETKLSISAKAQRRENMNLRRAYSPILPQPP
jgi:hypothetical protein